MKNYSLSVLLLLGIFASSNAQPAATGNTQQSEKIVRDFLEIVRSGKSPERAAEFMADSVKAHQLNAENPETLTRTLAGLNN